VVNEFAKTNEALRELRVACRQLACANLRMRMMLDELEAAGGVKATPSKFAAVVDKYYREDKNT
jgi:FKBP-type peptidyl-prolyl cis-trans isomerase (trigger factor)